MKPSGSMPKFVIILSGLLIMSCMLPGMIPLNNDATEAAEAPEPTASSAEMPTMEKDANKVIEALQGSDWVYLQALAEEQYTADDFARPGRLTFTVNITDDKSTYFNYAWCTTTEEILQQNFEHIRVGLFFNGEGLGEDVVHPVTYTSSNDMTCLDFGVLMSDWPAGEYKLEAVATFEEQINDGIADYEAGDYIFEYNVTVKK